MNRREVTSMWAEACAVLAQAERLQRQFFPAPPSGAAPAWEAPADVFEYGPEIVVHVALPGVEPQHVEVSIDGTWLRVGGVRRLRVTPRAAYIRRLEIPHGRFERRIELPSSDYTVEALEALNGCVYLRLRRG